MRRHELSCKSRQRIMLTQSSTLSLKLLISIIAFTIAYLMPAYTSAVFSQRDCHDLTTKSDCQCTTTPWGYVVECPRNESIRNDYDQKFTLKISSGEHVQIECDHVNARNYSLLPRMSIGPTGFVQIYHCHTPIARIFKHLGITKVNYLEFESNELYANLTRHHLSDLQSLTYLRFHSKTLHMPEDIFSDLKNLITLYLRLNNLTLTEKLFEPLKSLKMLILDRINLQTLPRGIFKNQYELTYLNLTGNRLHNFTKDLIENATKLNNIDLSANNIETFAPDVFQPLTNLEVLYVDRNNIRELPYDLFANNKFLKKFKLINNRDALISLPPTLFANLPYLEDVWLSCKLESVSENFFGNSTMLANLNMEKNRLATLPEKFLIHQFELQVLDLSHNRLQTLPNRLFNNPTCLQEIRLSYNRLSEISDKLFNYLFNLETLYLDSNNLHTIDKGAFIGLISLKVLNLANNKICLFEIAYNEILLKRISPFKFLPQLQELNLSNNSMKYMVSYWKTELLKLQKLDLSYNKITILHDYDLLFDHSVEISLVNNSIHEINFTSLNFMDGPFANGVQRIRLNNNPLHCDCRLLFFLQFIRGEYGKKFENQIELITKNLKCERPPNLINKLIDKLSYMELVCPLDDSASMEKRCSPACECWKRPYDQMLLVNCSNSNISRIPTLPQEPLIKGIELYVENNNIDRLPLGTTAGYAVVKRIHAAGNRLHQLEAKNLPKGLQYLDVRRNMLQRLSMSLLNFFKNSSTLDGLFLAQNAWICECDARPLLEFTKSNAMLQKLAEKQDFNQMRCATDLQYFKDISVADICTDVIIILTIFIALLGLIVGICLALFYKYNQEIKVFLYAHNWCLWFVTEEELDKDKRYDAFVSYTHKDEEFIADYLVPELEHGPIPFKLCIHVRDFIVGGCIPEQILRAVDESRRTIIVLSQNFIDSTWGRLEFRAAHQSSLNEKRNRLIVIIYGDIENMDNLDNELQLYVKTNTYLKWDDPQFWNKLRYAMPHRNGKRKGSLERSAMKGSIDDGLELGAPSPITPLGPRQRVSASVR